MQNVGLSKGEVRASIHSQVLTVFFLPLVMAVIHMTAAFPILKSLLEGMGMTKTWLFLSCTAVSFLVFAVFYIVVYLLTARSYYKIVSRGWQRRDTWFILLCYIYYKKRKISENNFGREIFNKSPCGRRAEFITIFYFPQDCYSITTCLPQGFFANILCNVKSK